MKKVVSTLMVSSLVLLCACKKKSAADVNNTSENQVTSTTTISNYSKLKVGNYWIYQRFSIGDSVTPLAIIDSCYIQKDTLINGINYFKYVSPDFGPLASPNSNTPYVAEYYRDSLDYLITSKGRVEFSHLDFNTIFKAGYQITPSMDTICKYEYKMGDQNTNSNTPSGNYITSSFKEIFYMYPNYSIGGNIRVKNTKYALNIGKVVQDWYFFANTPLTWQRRLIRYQVN